MSRPLFATLAALSLALALGPLASPASAHETRVVGKYKLTVGWNVEPPLVNSLNSLFLGVEDAVSGQAILGLEGTLKAEIIVGGEAEKKDLPLDTGEEPGVYLGAVIPTAVGDYIFRISGTIEGQAIDETFSSGPETFDPVEGIAQLQFPPTQPSNADDSDPSDTTLILAIIGIAAGAVGIGVAAIALATRRSR